MVGQTSEPHGIGSIVNEINREVNKTVNEGDTNNIEIGLTQYENKAAMPEPSGAALAYVYSENSYMKSLPNRVEGIVRKKSSNTISSNDPANNEELWSTSLSGNILSGHAVANGNIIVSHEGDNSVYAINGINGNIEWSTSISGDVETQPTHKNGYLIVGTDRGGSLTRLDPSNGDILWNISTDLVTQPPLINNGTLYQGTSDFTMLSINADDGSTNWTRNLSQGYGVDNTPTFDENNIYFGDNYGNFYSMMKSEPTENYVQSGYFTFYGDPTRYGDYVYFGDGNGFVNSFNKADGTENWTYDTGAGDVQSKPIKVDNQIIVGVADGKVISLAESDGTLNWSYSLANSAYGKLAYYSGNIFVQDDSGTLSSINANDGTENWTLSGTDSSDNPTLGMVVGNGWNWEFF